MDKKFNGKKIKIEFKQSSMIRVVEWSIDRSMTGQIFLRSNGPKNGQMHFRVNLIFLKSTIEFPSKNFRF